ncbi:unnamed protein product [Parnassius mnemosyne]|uniref:Transposase Tc1-like domain-containing protein n=2 Tax=Parnassius mnemosyne TaxID=213953 RepID=A0AAV1LAC4_9NEOP
MTLRRRWKEQNFSCRRPLKKPKLTPAMRLKRLEFAKKYKHWTVEDWHKVCFSDESSIQILQDHTQFVRRRPNEKFKEDCIVERVKHPLSIMIWGVISAKGNGRLYIVEKTMRQDQYIKVLSEKLIPQTSEWFPNKDFLFMHDSAPS